MDPYIPHRTSLLQRPPTRKITKKNHFRRFYPKHRIHAEYDVARLTELPQDHFEMGVGLVRGTDTMMRFLRTEGSNQHLVGISREGSIIRCHSNDFIPIDWLTNDIVATMHVGQCTHFRRAMTDPRAVAAIKPLMDYLRHERHGIDFAISLLQYHWPVNYDELFHNAIGRKTRPWNTEHWQRLGVLGDYQTGPEVISLEDDQDDPEVVSLVEE